MDDAPELHSKTLPSASLDALRQLRQDTCTESSTFTLQPFQLLMRRLLSPDSPCRNMLMLHGTGVGKTCTAIQVAEEYILRPEFQHKRVLVLSSATVKESFERQIFDVSRVKYDRGIFTSPQCTGRRYLDMLERAETEGLRWTDAESRKRMSHIVSNMIHEFYEFMPYQAWGNHETTIGMNLNQKQNIERIEKEYNNRLIIVDEAHNLRPSEESNKEFSDSLAQICKYSKGLTLVLLTATPMFDDYSEILSLFDLFLWNDHRQSPNETIKNIFQKNGDFIPNKEAVFRGWCKEYVSYLRGESPFAFPFRLNPPESIVALPDRTTDPNNNPIVSHTRFLTLTQSFLKSPQLEAVQKLTGGDISLLSNMTQTLVHIPTPHKKGTDTVFEYGGLPFASPSNLPKYAAKFDTILKCITDDSGIVFVYSRFIQGGIQEFAMALEEAGFEPFLGKKMIRTSGEYSGPSRGKYAYLTADLSTQAFAKTMRQLRASSNLKGSDIKVILGSPVTSEGIDFRNVRQVHVLDPWYNMSKLKQIEGRGLRTCSHSSLDFEDQNCTVYYHVCRYEHSQQETYDEFVYRMFVEEKAKIVGKLLKIIAESAIDCSIQHGMNQLPDEWNALEVPQRRSQDQGIVTLALRDMIAPSFQTVPSFSCKTSSQTHETSDFVRPLGSYYDVRDMVFDSIQEMFTKKPIWETNELVKRLGYGNDVSKFLLDDAITSHLKLRNGDRVGTLENRNGMYAWTNVSNQTLAERLADTTPPVHTLSFEVPDVVQEEQPEPPSEYDAHTFSPELEVFPDHVKRAYFQDQIADVPLHSKEGLVMVSPNEIYRDGKLIVPVGQEKDEVDARIATYIQTVAEEFKKGKLLCTYFNKELKISPFEVKDNMIVRINRSKTVVPKSCTSYKISEVNALLKHLGHSVPSNKKDVCAVLSMTIREAAPTSELLFWVTPDVWAFVADAPEKLRAAVK